MNFYFFSKSQLSLITKFQSEIKLNFISNNVLNSHQTEIFMSLILSPIDETSNKSQIILSNIDRITLHLSAQRILSILNVLDLIYKIQFLSKTLNLNILTSINVNQTIINYSLIKGIVICKDLLNILEYICFIKSNTEEYIKHLSDSSMIKKFHMLHGKNLLEKFTNDKDLIHNYNLISSSSSSSSYLSSLILPTNPMLDPVTESFIYIKDNYNEMRVLNILINFYSTQISLIPTIRESVYKRLSSQAKVDFFIEFTNDKSGKSSKSKFVNMVNMENTYSFLDLYSKIGRYFEKDKSFPSAIHEERIEIIYLCEKILFYTNKKEGTDKSLVSTINIQFDNEELSKVFNDLMSSLLGRDFKVFINNHKRKNEEEEKEEDEYDDDLLYNWDFFRILSGKMAFNIIVRNIKEEIVNCLIKISEEVVYDNILRNLNYLLYKSNNTIENQKNPCSIEDNKENKVYLILNINEEDFSINVLFINKNQIKAFNQSTSTSMLERIINEVSSMNSSSFILKQSVYKHWIYDITLLDNITSEEKIKFHSEISLLYNDINQFKPIGIYIIGSSFHSQRLYNRLRLIYINDIFLISKGIVKPYTEYIMKRLYEENIDLYKKISSSFKEKEINETLMSVFALSLVFDMRKSIVKSHKSLNENNKNKYNDYNHDDYLGKINFLYRIDIFYLKEYTFNKEYMIKVIDLFITIEKLYFSIENHEFLQSSTDDFSPFNKSLSEFIVKFPMKNHQNRHEQNKIMSDNTLSDNDIFSILTSDDIRVSMTIKDMSVYGELPDSLLYISNDKKLLVRSNKSNNKITNGFIYNTSRIIKIDYVKFEILISNDCKVLEDNLSFQKSVLDLFFTSPTNSQHAKRRLLNTRSKKTSIENLNDYFYDQTDYDYKPNQRLYYISRTVSIDENSLMKSLFINKTYKEILYLQSIHMLNFDFIFRPSTKGLNCFYLTFFFKQHPKTEGQQSENSLKSKKINEEKYFDDIIINVLIKERVKSGNIYEIGKKLILQSSSIEYNSLSDIYTRFILKYTFFLNEILENHRFKYDKTSESIVKALRLEALNSKNEVKFLFFMPIEGYLTIGFIFPLESFQFEIVFLHMLINENGICLLDKKKIYKYYEDESIDKSLSFIVIRSFLNVNSLVTFIKDENFEVILNNSFAHTIYTSAFDTYPSVYKMNLNISISDEGRFDIPIFNTIPNQIDYNNKDKVENEKEDLGENRKNKQVENDYENSNKNNTCLIERIENKSPSKAIIEQKFLDNKPKDKDKDSFSSKDQPNSQNYKTIKSINSIQSFSSDKTVNVNKQKLTVNDMMKRREEELELGIKNSQYNKEKIDIICFRCNKKGHTKRECDYIFCNYCKKEGHLKSDCIEIMNKERRYNERRSQHDHHSQYNQHFQYNHHDESSQINRKNQRNEYLNIKRMKKDESNVFTNKNEYFKPNQTNKSNVEWDCRQYKENKDNQIERQDEEENNKNNKEDDIDKWSNSNKEKTVVEKIQNQNNKETYNIKDLLVMNNKSMSNSNKDKEEKEEKKSDDDSWNDTTENETKTENKNVNQNKIREENRKIPERQRYFNYNNKELSKNDYYNHQRKNNKDNYPKQSSSIKCFNCNKEGHYKRECRELKEINKNETRIEKESSYNNQVNDSRIIEKTNNINVNTETKNNYDDW